LNVHASTKARVHDEVVATTTFGSEDSLPRVPLPTLEESCARFLEWCAPLLSADELAATERAVASFLRPESPAHALQAALVEYEARDGVRSWLDDFWSIRYLGRRDRIALNANYFYLLHGSGQGQVERAAGLIAAALDYKWRLDAQRIPPPTQDGMALSMEQQRFLFSTTRIPGVVQDTVRAPYSEDWRGPSRERHVVVFSGGSLFRMEVVGPRGRPHTTDELAVGLRAVRERAASLDPPRLSVGHLTTKPRAEWAESRRRLLDVHPRNAVLLDSIETALFCVCLDDVAPGGAREACEQLLHGPSGNRWFDKAITFVVFADGTAGLNVEHSCLDGITIVDFMDALAASFGEEHALESGAQSQGVPAIEPIELELGEELAADVRAAAASFAAAAADTAVEVLSLEDFGSSRVKELGVSPDAFVQMAFQLAHKRTRGFVGATYESIATRQFRNGRTEAMRVVTPEAARFVEAMVDPGVDESARRTAFLAAAETHVARARECRAGLAPEQHLWELQFLRDRRGGTVGAGEALELYESPGWLVMRDDYLSTSSTPTPNVQYGGFGPTSLHCIGVAYMLLPDRLSVHLSARRAMAVEMRVFAERLREAIRDLEQLVARA
jgi:carnitine O-acetyltransferase